ncbi:MAG TPA: phosphatase PAP2 family protein [Polyangiaceae bacterium]
MSRRVAFCLSFALGTWALPVRADDAPATDAAVPGAAKGDETEREKLVEELLAGDPAADDLAWLYSNADEYSPSGLTGEPIPAPALPERGEGSPRRWDPRWRKFGIANYVLTGTGFAIAAGSLFVPVTDPWQTRNPLDEWGRRTFGVSTYESGEWARDVSDVLISLNIAFPFLVDSLTTAYWYRRSPEVAGQTALIALEAMAVSSMLQGATSAWAARERPYGRDCGKTIPSELSECTGNERYRSFFSGHTSMSFATAAVSCTHHAQHELFGDPLADGITCGAELASAATVGMMRIVALKHYVTDVLTGAAVGTLSGLGVPWLLHYGPLARVGPESDAAVTWSLYPLVNGVAVRGAF